MEADQILAAIEKATVEIEIPRDWANLICLIPRKLPIFIHEMTQKEFFNSKFQQC